MMALPYASATSGAAALEEASKILNGFGCERFGTMTDNTVGELIVQFTHRGKNVTVRASFKGYAAAWLRENPYNSRRQCTQAQHSKKAMDQAKISVCSIVRDWIKAQITAIEVGMLSFEAAFLGQIQLADGRTVLDAAAAAGHIQLEGPGA
jgi:hypothetical protein